MNPAQELEGIIDAAKRDPKHPYSDPAHPEHRAMRDKVWGLTQAMISNRTAKAL